MIEKLIGKWERIGLTDGMDENKIPKLVQLYEDAAQILVKDDTLSEAGYVEALTFPVIYRVVRDVDIDIKLTAEEVITTVKNDFENLISIINKEPRTEKIDVEAEAAKRLCDIIIENIKK